MNTRALVLALFALGALALLLVVSSDDRGLRKTGRVESSEVPPSDRAHSPEAQSVTRVPLVLPPDLILTPGPRAVDDGLEDLTRWPEEAVIEVRIVAEESGEPLSDVHVVFFMTEGYRSEKTDRKGIARLPAPCGEVIRLLVGSSLAPRRSLEIAPLVPGEHHEVEVVLRNEPDLRFHGIVIDRDSRKPIFKARATATIMPFQEEFGTERNRGKGGRTAFHRGTSVDQAITRTDGAFSLLAPSWGESLHLRIEADGYTPAVMPMDWDFQEAEQARTIELRKSAKLELRISGATKGPVQHLKVLARTDSFHLTRQRSHRDRVWSSDPVWVGPVAGDGSCFFEELPSEVPIHLTIYKGEFPDLSRLRLDTDALHRELLTVVLMPGESRDMQIEVGAGTTIRGRMVDGSGNPFGGHTARLFIPRPGEPGFARFWLGRVENSETDENGFFTFFDVPPGTWWISSAQERHSPFDPKPEYQAVSLPQEVVVPAGADAIDVELCFQRGSRIAGIVVDPSGRPARSSRPRRAEISVSARSEQGVINAWCDDAGAFSLGPVPPGSFELRAFSHDGTGDYAESILAPVAAGERAVILQLQFAGILEGTVIDSATAEVCYADLYVSPPGPGRRSREGRANREGLFRIKRLSPGTSTVFARSKDGRVGFLRDVEVVGSGETSGLVVQVRKQGHLRLVVPPDGTRWTAMVYAEGMRIGTLKPWMPEFAVPVGEVTLKLDGVRNAGDSERTVMIEDGKTTQVAFE